MSRISGPTPRVVVVGAGVGGLTTAALLARAGLDVTVLEAHVYPGGCAGTFFNRGYRFDAGATLAGGFSPDGPMTRLAALLDLTWPAHPVAPTDPAMVVHLPDGVRVRRWAEPECWVAERLALFGHAAEPFWRWQEQTADVLWRLAAELPPWPPRSGHDVLGLARAGLGARLTPWQLPSLALDAGRPVAAHLRGAARPLRQFVDAQLLIAAQTTSQRANALYGAAALDLPRRGVVHLDGGIGAISEALLRSLRASGGTIHYRQAAIRVTMAADRPVAVETAAGETFPADVVVLNLPARGAAELLGRAAPARLRAAPPYPRDGWSAFTLHVGLVDGGTDGANVGPDTPLHHQVVVREPLGEGNSIFLSLSPSGDARRAPAGHRALTISTHTRPGSWWELFERDRSAYEARKARYVERLLDAAEVALPGLRAAASLILPGTPVTFQRYTGRDRGWVGGLPQTSLFRAGPPYLAPGLWQVGDSIFPGQSTAAVALGGMRVARAILHQIGVKDIV